MAKLPYRVLCGGSWRLNQWLAHCIARLRAPSDSFLNYLGFRVVKRRAYAEKAFGSSSWEGNLDLSRRIFRYGSKTNYFADLGFRVVKRE